MATNEKHHYVPQFYLKNFSVENNRKTIALYNHKNGTFVSNASIKGQAYERFLYGEDNIVEAELSKLESEAAKLFHDPITKIIPPLEIPTFRILKQYILAQLARTTKAGKDTIEMLNQAYQKLHPYLSKQYGLNEQSFMLSHKFPSLLSVLFALQNLPMMNFLIIKSFVNLTQIPFITSDAPVILYNQFMESKGDYLGATGLAIMGLQIFFPIHPRLMYCLYDPKTYIIGDPDKISFPINDEMDIHQLNALQYLFSNSHLYFDETISVEYIKKLVQDFEPFRIENKTIVETFTEKNEGKEKFYLFSSFTDPHINLDLPFIKLTRKAKSTSLNGDLPFRHPWFYEFERKRRKA